MQVCILLQLDTKYGVGFPSPRLFYIAAGQSRDYDTFVWICPSILRHLLGFIPG